MLVNAESPSVHYAVTRSDEPGSGLTAHAWVEMNGYRVAGDPAEDDAVTLAPRPTP